MTNLKFPFNTRNFKTSILLSVAILVGTGQIAAQGAGITMVKDPKAEKILDKLSEKSKSYGYVYASFTYNMKNKDADIDETQNGELWFNGDKYRVELEGMQRISDGKVLYTYLEEEDELQISSAASDDESDEILKPSQLLTIHEQGFKYKHDGTVTADGRKMDVIALYPEKADKAFHTVKLYVDQSKTEIYKIEIYGKDGNTFTYKLNKLNTSASFSDDKFSFDQSKAGDVIDLR